MNAATGLSLTNLVRARHSRPREEATFSTLVSALVEVMKKRVLLWTAMRSSGVIRTPMLVGQAIA